LYITDKAKEVTVSSLKIKKGEIFVNKKPASDYFPSEVSKKLFMHPLELTGNADRFAISILIKGGGLEGQLEAMIHGLARAVEKSDKEKRPVLKKDGLLTRDARIKERRKVGTGGKARRQKQSPKR
jgi:small subunit ribosomal protein S9